MESSEGSATFENPVIRGFNPDPTICVVPASGTSPTTYFLSTSTFEYFPGCAIYSSTDLVNWTLIGHALTRRSQIEMRTVEPGAGSWASTLRYRTQEKRWYLTTGVFQRYRPFADERIFPRGFYVWTDNIYDDNSWSDPVYFDNPGFDQDLFWDDDGKVYLSTTVRFAKRPANSKQKDFGIHISEIDLLSGRTLTAPQVIRKSPHGIAEGSHIIKNGKYYYLFTAEGGTEAGHQEWVFRSTVGPYGPWEGQDKALWFNGPNEEVQRTGHADIFEDAHGKCWAVFLGVRPVKDGGEWLEPQLGRETFLVKVDWVDDWPVFNDGKNITLLTNGHNPVHQRVTTTKGKERISLLTTDQVELSLGWYEKNTPLKKEWSLTEKPGHLRIYGGCYDLSSPESPSMLLRKQCTYEDKFHADLQFNPSKVGYEAGIVLWWSQYAYASIGVARCELPNGDEVVTIVFRRPGGTAGDIQEIHPLLSREAAPTLECGHAVEMEIEAQPTSYKLTITSRAMTESFEVPARDLTVMPPVGGTFCGTMFGVYAFGKSEPVLDPVYFSNIWTIS